MTVSELIEKLKEMPQELPVTRLSGVFEDKVFPSNHSHASGMYCGDFMLQPTLKPYDLKKVELIVIEVPE
jgi:hypothetical protein